MDFGGRLALVRLPGLVMSVISVQRVPVFLVLLVGATLGLLPTPAGARDSTHELDPEVVARAVEEYLARREATVTPATNRWERVLESLEISGDLRFRHESSVKLDQSRDRHRELVRVRLGATYELQPWLSVGARLTTGARTDPNSANVTLGNGFDSFEVSLDRAFAKLTPTPVPGAWLMAGKFAHPFVANPVYPSVLWDTDVSPEGVAAGYEWKGEGFLRAAGLTGGQYLLLEQSGASDTSLSVAQLSTSFALCDRLGARTAVGYYHYGSTQPDGSRALVSDNQGNATLDRDGDGTPDAYASRFGVVNSVAVVTSEVASVPIVLSGEWIANVRTGDRKQGWVCGAALGSAKDPGDWQVYYQWQVVEEDALFAAVANNDFVLGTNYRGHVFGAKACVAQDVVCHVYAFATHREHRGTSLSTNSESAQWRLRFDLEFRF